VRIVIGVDEDRPWPPAVRLLREAPWPRPVEVVLVAAYGPPADWCRTQPVVFNEEDEEVVRERLRRMLADAAHPIRELGASVVLEVRAGQPGDVLIEVARQRSADLLVVGSDDRTATGHPQLDTLVADLVDRAPCPVVVAPGSTADRVRSADGLAEATPRSSVPGRWDAVGAHAIRFLSLR
jgi:nucleotide-binding universal stress UspA family protein